MRVRGGGHREVEHGLKGTYPGPARLSDHTIDYLMPMNLSDLTIDYIMPMRERGGYKAFAWLRQFTQQACLPTHGSPALFRPNAFCL